MVRTVGQAVYSSRHPEKQADKNEVIATNELWKYSFTVNSRKEMKVFSLNKSYQPMRSKNAKTITNKSEFRGPAPNGRMKRSSKAINTKRRALSKLFRSQQRK